MKPITVMMGLVFTIMTTVSFAQVDHSYILVGLASKQIEVSTKKMTALMLPAGVRRGTYVSREISVQKVKDAENMLEVKALKENFMTTNLNVYCVDGKLYSFDLVYNDLPAVVNYAIVNAPSGSALAISPTPAPIIPVQLTGIPTDEVTLKADADSLARLKRHLHKSVTIESMRLRLKGIYIKDSLLWFSLNIQNYSAVPYKSDYLRLYVIDKKRPKRTAVQQVAIIPVYENTPAEISKEATFSIGYPLFTISKNKKLLLEFSEMNGGRLLQLYISHKCLLQARKE